MNSGAIEAAAVAAGADPTRIAHIIWHTQLSGFGPEQADRDGLRAELGWPQDALIVLSLRNFQERTNIDVLVRAFARVAPRAPAGATAAGGSGRRDAGAGRAGGGRRGAGRQDPAAPGRP